MIDHRSPAWMTKLQAVAAGDAGAEDRAAVEAHVAECAECRAALADLGEMERAPLPPPESLPAAWRQAGEKAEAQIAHRWEAERKGDVVSIERARARRRTSVLMSLAAAAGLAAGATGMYACQSRRPSPPPIARNGDNTPQGPRSYPLPAAPAGVDIQIAEMIGSLPKAHAIGDHYRTERAAFETWLVTAQSIPEPLAHHVAFVLFPPYSAGEP